MTENMINSVCSIYFRIEVKGKNSIAQYQFGALAVVRIFYGELMIYPIGDFVQDCRNSSALAMELLQPCADRAIDICLCYWF